MSRGLERWAFAVIVLGILAGVYGFAAAQAIPAPTLFDVAWEERSQFAADVQLGWRDEALSLDDAPVYHLVWSLHDATELTARQEVRVVNYSSEPWQELYFQLLPNLLGGRLAIEGLRLNGEELLPQFVDGNRLLRVELPVDLEPGDAVVVGLDYTLTIPTTGGGNYGILAYREGVLSLAHAYALLSVYGPDGWDNDRPPRYGDLVFAQSSFFQVRLDAPLELEIAASGREFERRVEGERQQLQIVAGPVRDFYLVAGQELEPAVATAGDVEVRGHATPGTSNAMERAVEIAAQAIEIFVSRYGPYPFTELDVVAISTTALGVEFPGIIALRHELLAPEGSELLESTVVHEVAHQWFYSLVGNDQVSEPWLDESLTQYLTLRYYLQEHGAQGYRTFRESLSSRWERVDREPALVGRPVAEYDVNEYGAIVYGLGPLVVEWLAGIMGRPAFDIFLRDYVERYAFGLVRTEDFRELAEQHCHCSLTEFFNEWVVPQGER
ncbi:MAG: M1 family metallopeptidase [Trueperaceae bacterium]